MKLLLFAICLTALGCSDPPRSTQFQETRATPPADKPPPAVDRWDISVSKNELDGTKKIAITDSEVVMRCAPKLEAYVIPPLPQLGHMLQTNADRVQRVRYRMDDQTVRTGYWAVSDSFDSLFMPTSIARDLGKHHRLVLEYSPEYTTAQTHTFDLTGLADAENKAGCKIK